MGFSPPAGNYRSTAENNQACDSGVFFNHALLRYDTGTVAAANKMPRTLVAPAMRGSKDG